MLAIGFDYQESGDDLCRGDDAAHSQQSFLAAGAGLVQGDVFTFALLSMAIRQQILDPET